MSKTLVNRDGLLFDGDKVCGYIVTFGIRTFAPDGEVGASDEEVKTHNRLLDEAMLKGLDENCEVGSFYFDPRMQRVTTFCGTVVAEGHSVYVSKGRLWHTITFKRKGKIYQGRLSNQFDLFNFRRVKTSAYA